MCFNVQPQTLSHLEPTPHTLTHLEPTPDGDVLPLTNAEYGVVVIYMTVGGVIWAYVIGSLTGKCQRCNEESVSLN